MAIIGLFILFFFGVHGMCSGAEAAVRDAEFCPIHCGNREAKYLYGQQECYCLVGDAWVLQKPSTKASP